jgi:predicted nucleotidyltransferase
MRPSEILAAKTDEIREVIARYPVRNPRVFGSVARGEDTEGSDLDILVDPLEGTSLFDLAGLELELTDLLGVEVDVVTPKSLAPDVAGRVEPDVRPL